MDVITRLKEEKLVAVVRAETQELAYEFSKAIIKGGIKAIEITFTVPNAEGVITRLTEEYKDDVYIGAGTVLDVDMCQKAIKGGANYIVSPGFDESCAEYCYEMGIPYIPGCMTLTEMMNAMKFHVEVIKLFPGSHFSTSFIKSIKGPLPNINLMVTGGIDLNNMNEWLNLGASMVGIGGSLTNQYVDGSFDEITKKTKQFVQQLKDVK